MTSRRLQWTLTGDGAGAVLQGVIDEHSELPKLGEALRAQAVSLDVGGVRRINSLGVRMWIQLMRALAGRQVALRRCPPVLVEQLNYLKDFRGHAVVESVLVPYACEKCGTQMHVEMETQKLARDRLPRGPACEGCGQPTQLDDFPEHYLSLVHSP